MFLGFSDHVSPTTVLHTNKINAFRCQSLVDLSRIVIVHSRDKIQHSEMRVSVSDIMLIGLCMLDGWVGCVDGLLGFILVMV